MGRDNMEVIWDVDENCPGLKKAWASANLISENVILSQMNHIKYTTSKLEFFILFIFYLQVINCYKYHKY